MSLTHGSSWFESYQEYEKVKRLFIKRKDKKRKRNQNCHCIVYCQFFINEILFYDDAVSRAKCLWYNKREEWRNNSLNFLLIGTCINTWATHTWFLVIRLCSRGWHCSSCQRCHSMFPQNGCLKNHPLTPSIVYSKEEGQILPKSEPWTLIPCNKIKREEWRNNFLNFLLIWTCINIGVRCIELVTFLTNIHK